MNNLFSLSDRTALVTGSTGHLGRAMVVGLAQMGARVLAHGRNTEKVEEFVAQCQKQNLLVEKAIFDVNSYEEIKQFFCAFPYNSLDILVNNAYAGVGGTIETASPENYLQSYSVSVVAAQNMIQLSLPFLRHAVQEKQDASVINIASMYGMVSPNIGIYDSPEGANPPFYGAAKAALIQLTKYAACQFATEKIRINAVSPGPFPSDLAQEQLPEMVKKIEQKVPMKRIGHPDDLKSAICFLASPASSYITGINLPVDGGWTSW